MAKSNLSRREKKMYEKHLRDLNRTNPEPVHVVLDVTEEDSDWLRQPARREPEARD